MKMIGKNLIRYFLLLGFGVGFLSFMEVRAQEFTLEATVSENQIFVGEQFTLSIEIQGSSLRNVELPNLPELNGVRVLSTTPSRGQSISIINGRTTTSTTYRYNLIARDQGSYRIPPITVVIDGEEHQTNPVSIEIREKSSLQSESGTRRPDIFSVIELNEKSPIIGQQLVASLVIYFKEGIEVTSYQPSPGWRTDGFWKEELENIEQPKAETEIFGNVRYRKATLLRYALFPSRSGTLTLSPFELHLGIRSQPRRSDPFGSVFGGFGTNQRRVTVETEPIEVSVRRIDPPQRGISIGAVGNFSIEREASITRAYVGESIELVTRINGRGNLPLISKPDYTFPDSFEMYQPQEETDLNRRGTTISGTRTFRDIVVPRTAGTFTLPEKQIAVYRPENESYQYMTLPSLSIEVTRDPSANLAESSGNFSLQPVGGLAVWRGSATGSLFDQNWIWIGFALPLLALLIGYRQKRHLDRLQTDHSFARSHYAWNQAMNRLESAREELKTGTPKTTYNLLHKALTGFIADRLSLPEAGISDDEIRKQIRQKTDDENINRKVKQLLDKCATISYAPIGSSEDIVADIDKTEEILKRLRSIL
ncbi:MAG: BatD family protein [Balneolaceae bacterium]